jgi:glycosyltransferase involved in cell wall biosynthesis
LSTNPKRVLCVQIPCFNEAGRIGSAVSEIPRQVPGFDEVKVVVIDDGSSDGSAEEALAAGADRIVTIRPNRGLANAFTSGIEACLDMGADVIVNTDADSQYEAEDIGDLTAPIVADDAEVVVGCRDMKEMLHFSAWKRMLQNLGSWFVRVLTGLPVQDATSGFRAFHRSAAEEIFLYTRFTYTIETLFLFSDLGIRVVSVPIRAYETPRKSRLFKGNFQYIRRTIQTVLQTSWIYRPVKLMAIPATLFIAIGLVFIVRFLISFADGDGAGKTQSLVIASLLIIVGIQALATGVIGQLINSNRLLVLKSIELIRERDRNSSQQRPEVEVEARTRLSDRH